MNANGVSPHLWSVKVFRITRDEYELVMRGWNSQTLQDRERDTQRKRETRERTREKRSTNKSIEGLSARSEKLGPSTNQPARNSIYYFCGKYWLFSCFEYCAHAFSAFLGDLNQSSNKPCRSRMTTVEPREGERICSDLVALHCYFAEYDRLTIIWSDN